MPISNQKETIDIRILRLIGLEDVFDLDYDTYATLLKEAMIKGRMAKTAIPTEEVMLLTEEYKRIKTKKGRFEVRKKNKIGPTSFSVGSIKGKISSAAPVKALPGTSIGKSPAATSVENNISAITFSFISILDTLKKQKKQDEKEDEYGRRKSEQEKRALTESKLEKRFEGLKKVAEKVIAPVKSLLDRILEFFTTVILGRIVYKLIEWMGDPKNASKVKSIIRFVKDWWPALIGGFVLFGTRFGKGVRILTKIALSAVGKLSKAIPVLLRFAKKNPAAALGIASGAYAATQLSQRAFSGGSEEQGGVVKFAGGGFNFGFTNIFNGLVSGEKGVDKVPAMLSDGEFVMSRGAVQKYGVDTLESMNAAGGGTNKPKVIGGTTYAAGGGPIGRRNPNDYKSGLDPVAELRKHFNNFIRSRGAGRNFDIGNPSTWGGGGGGTSASGGGGSGGFLSGLGYLGKYANQVPKIVRRRIGYAGKVAGEVNRRVTPTLGYAGKDLNEAKKMAAPTLNRAGKVVEGVKQKAGSTIDSIKNFDFKGLGALSSSISGAATEALPALLGSTLGISRTDKSISEDMQRQLLQARATAAKRGRNYVDYKDYDGGGLLPGGFTAGGLTMGRIADKEWKRDAQGRIIGLRQVYDTNRSAKEAWNQGMQGFGQFGSSLMKGKLNKEALGRGIYKPFEALLALTQHRGKTMHDVNFDEKVLGFKPGKEVLNDTQKRMIAAQRNREALQDKRPWWDKMGIFGGASAQIKKEQENRNKSLSNSPSVKLYDKPQRNTGQPYKSRFARPKNAGMRPVKPPTTKSPKVVYSPGGGGMGGARGTRPSRPQTPNFSATAKGSNSKAKTLGITR